MNYLTSDELDSLRNDICPDCVRINLDAGPRGGFSQNLICRDSLQCLAAAHDR